MEEMKKVFSPATINKLKTVQTGTEVSIQYAKKYGIKIAFGTDAWGPSRDKMHNEWKARTKYFSNFEILNQATAVNGELLQLTGLLNPYPDGPIGVIEEGAYADIILVEGNPLEEITIMKDKSKIGLVMKDGTIYKNTLK
jgi:imidazolonepropionase-like amidohydrolase